MPRLLRTRAPAKPAQGRRIRRRSVAATCATRAVEHPQAEQVPNPQPDRALSSLHASKNVNALLFNDADRRGTRGLQADLLLQMQKTRGNRYVQRVLDLARQAEGSGESDSGQLRSPRFSSSAKLGRCFANLDRLAENDPDKDAVTRVQQALLDLPTVTGNKYDLGSTGADGNYGQKTASAIRKFKADENLGSTEFGDVGPGTMRRLDQLFASVPPSPPCSEGQRTPGSSVCPPVPKPPSPTPAKSAHYRFEIKAWIPLPSVPDPEEPVRDLAFRLNHPNDFVENFNSQYRGDTHSEYKGSFRVFQVAEFDWDGVRISNLTFPTEIHFGTSHREFSAFLTTMFEFPKRTRFVHGVEVATVDHSVRGSSASPQEVDLGMSSPNPLTIIPAPDIDADYSIFISQDTFGIETVTVRWTTDFMPNHGFRVLRNGTVVQERIVNALPGPVSSAEILIRLNSKSNGGAVTFEPGP